MDLTFNNGLIKKYFEGSDEYVPSGELVWLHTHPLFQPNFLNELEQIILNAGKVIAKHKLSADSQPISQYIDIAIRMGKELPEINYENAPRILQTMREAYKVSQEIIQKLGN